MTIKIAINGLGRIGRCVLRAVYEMQRKDIKIVAVNGPAPLETHIHLLKYDSVHGVFPDVRASADGKNLQVAGDMINLLHEKDPACLPWQALDVDVVLECTGKFTAREGAAMHLKAGAKKVLISAPSPDADATIVYGVNHSLLQAGHHIVSVGSCTTNCLAPVAKILHDSVGIEHGMMTTIHAYTSDQNIMDNSHKDLRRARAAHLSMIPTSTGAAKALALVIPELKGKLDGVAVRVPTPNVSLVDLTFTAVQKTSVEALHQIVEAAADGAMKGVLAYHREPLVSIDFNHSPMSSIVDLTATKVIGGRLCRIASWYDNEWGFSARMLDVAALLKQWV